MKSLNLSASPALVGTVKRRRSRVPRGRNKLPRMLYAYGLRCIGRSPTALKADPIPLLTQQNIADLLSVSRVSVFNWIQAGKISPVKIEEKPHRKLFSIEQVLTIAANAIREGRAAALLAKPMPKRTAAVLNGGTRIAPGTIAE